MNNRAQIGIGILVAVFIVVVTGSVLMLDVAQTVGLSSTTITDPNITIEAGDMPAVDARVDLQGQDLLSTPVVLNGTGGQTIASGNYTIDEIISTTTGVKTISFRLDDPQFSGTNLTANGADFINMSYTYGPDGYINDSGARGMAALIPIFFALLIAIVALTPTIQSKIIERFS